MTIALELRPLVGTNPLGLLAALGALDVLSRSHLAVRPTLRWTTGLAPRAVLTGVDTVEGLVELLDADRAVWADSPVLRWTSGGGKPLDDLKPSLSELRLWAEGLLRAEGPTGHWTQANLFCGLLAEGAAAGKGDAKPTHLHFTAGQQRFLAMVRQLCDSVDVADLAEAVVGPWRYESDLPILGWDSRGERIYALRGVNPASERRTGVPGADWLAFLGLRFFPVFLRDGQLETTGCERSWKVSSFTWPLWMVPMAADSARSLLTYPNIDRLDSEQLAAAGISQVLRAPIRRSERGGYGSFGAAEPIVTAWQE